MFARKIFAILLINSSLCASSSSFFYECAGAALKPAIGWASFIGCGCLIFKYCPLFLPSAVTQFMERSTASQDNLGVQITATHKDVKKNTELTEALTAICKEQYRKASIGLKKLQLQQQKTSRNLMLKVTNMCEIVERTEKKIDSYHQATTNMLHDISKQLNVLKFRVDAVDKKFDTAFNSIVTPGICNSMFMPKSYGFNSPSASPLKPRTRGISLFGLLTPNQTFVKRLNSHD